MAEEILHSEYLYRGHILRLRLEQARLPNKSIVAREIVEHRGAVTIVALDEKDHILLVRQYRSGAAQELWELPAGTMEEGEDPALCANRELTEETGYHALQWDYLGYFYSTPGFCTEKLYLFLARQLTRGTPIPEEDELIQVERVPLAEAIGMIERGEIMDAKTIVGLMRVWNLLASQSGKPSTGQRAGGSLIDPLAL